MKSRQEKVLLSLLNAPGNRNQCCECSSSYPTWASCNLGIFLCGKCASAHRALGEDVSVVKSLSLDTWTSEELDFMERMGNDRNHRVWNARRIPFPFNGEDKDTVISYLRDKYVLGKFRNTPISEEDYHLDVLNSEDFDRSYGGRRDRFRDYEDNASYTSGSSGGYGSHRRTSRSRSYARSYSSRNGSSASLTLQHRPSTGEERRKYGDMARKMKFDMGYEDLDLNIEALSRTHGNLSRAARLVENEGSSSRREDSETPPPLPQRRDQEGKHSESSSSLAKKQNGETYDWIDSNPSTSAQASTPSSAPNNSGDKIYQYVDPNTGMYYYLDKNGQQYVDPAQGQRLQMQQTAAYGVAAGGMPTSMLANPSVPTVNPGANTSSLTLNQLNQLKQQQQQQQQQQFQQQTGMFTYMPTNAMPQFQTGVAPMQFANGAPQYQQPQQPQQQAQFQQQNKFTGF